MSTVIRNSTSFYSPRRSPRSTESGNDRSDSDGEPPILWSRVVHHTARSDRGDIRRCWDPLTQPELGLLGCRTLYEGFRRGCSTNPLGPCMGFRAVSTTGFATPFIYSSYTECLARVDAFAAGLEALDLVKTNSEGLTVLGIYLPNCMEWCLAEQAIYCVGGCTAPFYDTLGPDTVHYIVQETECSSVVSSRKNLEKLCQAADQQNCPCFTTIILVDGVTPDAASRAQQSNLRVISFAKIEAIGAEKIATLGHQHKPPNHSDIATFCYTSGTTGSPKGALLTHENLLSGLSGFAAANADLSLRMNDRHISYLPLAHIMERMLITSAFLSGASVGFYRGDPLYLIEDWIACRPTILLAAPRVLNKIYDKIYAGIGSASGMKRKLFDSAVATKLMGLRDGNFTHAVYDRLVFNKIKYSLGLDQVRILVSGSAPLNETVMSFFRILLGAPVVEGYGQTEGSGAASIGHSYHLTTGHVGGPIASVEMVLMDVPEMGYTHHDTVHRGQPCHGRGEICIRGPNVFKGYYKKEEATKETVDDEGWLHSGDIGLWRPDGTLQIIDRKKNLFKLSQGEYVAPEKIENILQQLSLIAQCFVHGDSFRDSLVAIVVPDEVTVQQWASKDPSLSSLSFDELCERSELKETILADIARQSHEAGLSGFEIVRAVYIESKPFTIEKGFLTPTFKLKRHNVKEAYEKELEALYNSILTPKSKL